jgi:nicotinate-nucleotide adenylyltransferase
MGHVDRFLLFGGSFDPIHHGHLIVSRFVAERLGIPRVILVPSARPPHKPDGHLAPAADRLAMCRLAVDGDPRFAVSDWEISQPGPNYTLHTIEHYHSISPPGAQLYWLVGMDSLRELSTWYQAGQLVERCTIVSTARPGFPRPDAGELAVGFAPAQVEKLLQHFVEGPRVDIAGTDIRARVHAGLSIRYLVPEPVERYVEEHALYR